MYAPFFGLKQEPFSIAPDPRYLFMSERHREALAHLLYGLGGGGGFVLLTGEIGAGKTTVCRCFLEQIPRRCNVAYIFNPKLTVTELLRSVCDEFGIPFAHQGPGTPTVKDYIDPLNEFLLKTHAVGQNNVLIIDEAQNLSADVLEQLRLLTNLETNERKLLQIILIGQPELRTMLAKPELEQLAQRVIARFHLEALSEKETMQYIRHRLAVAGMSRSVPFERNAMRRIHQLSRGVPRRINLLCDRALLGAYADNKSKIDRAIVDKAAGEVFDTPTTLLPQMRRGRVAWIGTGVGVGLAAGVALFAVVTAAVDSGARKPSAAPVQAAATQKLAPPAAIKPVAAVTALPASQSAAVALADARTIQQSLIRTERDAWRELAPAWRLTLPDGDPCEAAQQQQVRCFRSTSSNLALMRQLGRPGIVSLRDESNRTGYALLTGLTDRNATLRTGGVSHTVSLAALAQMWRGDFATFWRAPGGYLNNIADGESGPAVDALAAQLATARGQALPSHPQRFDMTLKSQVSAFQLAQGLKADGVAGPTTFMQLNRASGIDEPRLSSEK